jgi:hypothetical protein
MEVLQIIQGREAVPVRAIPFLTGWEEMPPDKVAEALAGINHYGHFEGFTAYKLRTDGSIKKTFSQEWRIVVADLAVIDITLKDTQTSVGTGRDLWRKQSISTLPAGVFVWRDELAKQYASSVRRTNYCKSGIDGEASWLKPPEMEFDIEVSSKWASLVLEGFAPANVTPQVQQSKQAAPAPELTPAQTAAAPEPVVEDSARTDTTPAPERRLARLRAMGGTAKYRHNEWKFTSITALVASEKSEGRKRCDEKTIRADLREAANNEREAKRAGFADGLGQR